MACSWVRNSCVGRVLNRKAVRSPPSTASPSASANEQRSFPRRVRRSPNPLSLLIGKCQGNLHFPLAFTYHGCPFKVGLLKVLNKKEVGMTTITLEEARLIIKRWAESSALLLVATSEQPGDVIGRFSVVETTDGGVLLRSVGGDTQFSLDLSHYETTCSYSEPREYSETEEYKGGFLQYRTPRS